MDVVFPDDLSGLDDAALVALADSARNEGAALLAAESFSTANADRLDELAAGLSLVEAEQAVRAEADAALAARRTAAADRFASAPVEDVVEDVVELAVETPEVPEVAEVVEAPLVATTAVTPARPGARVIAGNAPAPKLPVNSDGIKGNPGRKVTVAAGHGTLQAGSQVSLVDLVPAAMRKWSSYAGVNHAEDALFTIELPKLDPKLYVNKGSELQSVIDYATDQSRLVGSNGAQGLIAAGGWCAPTPQEYNVCTLAGLDGLLDLPTIGMPRGSLSYFRHLPFDTVEAQLADGFACYTQAELEADPPLTKPCVEIDCPAPVSAELEACSLCIRAGLIQMKGFPEYVAAWMDLAMIAYRKFLNLRKINQLLALIAADSGAPIVIPATFGSIAALLSAIRLAAVDLRAFHGMTQDRVLEVVLPYWIHDVLAVDHSRRQFNSEDNYTLAEFMSALRDIGVSAQFIKQWQDPFGGAVPATDWPASVEFLIYPAGAYVEAREDIINVGTMTDTALLTTNRVQLLFIETASQVIAACGSGRHYFVDICPSGATAGPIETTPGELTCPSIEILAIAPDDNLDTAGGEAFTITGTNLQGTTAVTFGGTAVTSFVVVSPTTITGVTPAKAAASYDVVVTSPLGSDTLVAGVTYV